MKNKTSPFNVFTVVAILAILALAASNIHLLGALREARRAADDHHATCSDKPSPEGMAQGSARGAAEATNEAARAADEAIAAIKVAPLRAVAAEWDDDPSGVHVFFSEGSWFKAPQGDEPFSFVPPVKDASWHNDWHNGNDTILIRGEFEPETAYTVTLRDGWSSSGDKTLAKPARLSFRTGHARPTFSLAASGKYYPASRPRLRLPYTAGGVTNIHVTIGRVYDNDVPLFGMERSEQTGNAHFIAEGDIPVMSADIVKATPKNGFIDLGAIMKDPAPGIYVVEIETSPETRRNIQWEDGGFFSTSHSTMLALTDLAVQYAMTAGNSAGRAAAFVTAFGTGLPVAGAEVTVMTRKHQVAGRGVTGPDGLAIIDLSPDDGDSPWIVTAAANGDFAAINLDDDANLAHQGDGAAHDAATAARALVFSERELCRPGESFESAIFARTPPAKGAMALAGAPADLVLLDPSGETAGRQRVTTDAHGFARAKWTIPASAAMGVWRVECDVGGQTAGTLQMRVASYRPDRVKAEITPSTREAVGLSTPVTISGSAAYYFGAPLSDGECRFTAVASNAEPPKRWKGWHVGVSGLKDCKEWSNDTTIAADGAFSMCYPGPASHGASQAFAPVAVAIAAMAQEPGGAGVAVGDSLLFHPTPDYIGVREANDAGTAFDFAILPAIEAAPPSNPAQLDIAVSLIRHTWERHLEKDGAGRLTMRWTERHEKDESLSRTIAVPAGEAATWTGRLEYAESELPEGRYTMEAACGDSRKTVFDFWHWAGEAGTRSSSPATIAIEAGAPSYAPGDTATLSFRSPFDGTACVVSGSAGVDAAQSLAVTQGVNRIKIAIPDSAIAAKYHVSVTLVAGDGRETPRLSGIAAIALDNSRSRRLDAAMALPQQARPGETIRVTITLRDGAGNPASGLVRLAAIDEGVAALTEFHVADAYGYFFQRKFGTPFSNYDCFGSIFPDMRIMPDGTFGGDGVSATAANRLASVIKEKETVSLVLPPVEVDATGSATVAVAVPDHLGALRFMAVAASREAAGSCEESLVVRDVVSVLPTVPLFATAGDRFTLTAKVFNHDADEGDWRLAIDLPHGLSASGGAATEFSGRLARGADATATLDVVVADAASGALDIPLSLSLGDQTASAIATVNIRPPRPAETRVTYMAITNGAATIPPDAAGWIGGARSTITLHASPAFALADSLSWLAGYPYGCLEQTVSAAFPFIAVPDLESLGLIDDGGRASAEARVKAAYAEILGMRLPGGGFAMWPWSNDEWTDGSIYACHFIFEARRAGMISPPKSLIDAQCAWLREVACDTSPSNRLQSAYSAYVLSLADDLAFATAARNVLDENDGDFPALLAAAALVRGGFAYEGVAAYERAIAARVWENCEDYDRARNAGMALFIACGTGHGDIASLAPAALRLNALLRADGSAWGTTRDNAWAALGLAPFAARVGAGFGTGTVAAGKAAPEAFDASSKPVRVVRDPAAPVAVTADGPLFASVSTVGVPATPSADFGPVSITRRYVDSNGNNVSSVRHGDLVTAVVEIRSPREIEDAVIADLIPGGFELVDASFATRSTLGRYTPPESTPEPSGFQEFRDDRWLWFGDIGTPDAQGRPQTLTYHLQAIVPGTFTIPSGSVEAMYDPELFGRIAPAGHIEVRQKP